MSRVLHRTGAIPPVAVRGEGIWLHTADGRAIIDASGGAAVAALGHGNRRVAEAIARQASTMAYAHTGTFSNQPAEDLAELLLADEPGGLTRAWFCSSGSEGNEAAIKLARQYFLEIGQPGRVRTIARRQSYHGTTLGALAAGGNMMRREYYEPILSKAHSLVSPCFPYRFRHDGETDAAYLERLSDELEAEFQRLGPETVIAFLAEPVVGATTGCVAAIPGYFRRVREICDRHGALLILDEVMCGMGRTGTMHAWEQEGISPDIQVIAKGSKLLAEIGYLVKAQLRLIDFAFRYGGDEFVVLLPQTSKDSALVVAKRLQDGFRASSFCREEGLNLNVRASIGLATYPHDAKEAHDIIRQADAMMYMVKNSTRDNIGIAQRGVMK